MTSRLSASAMVKVMQLFRALHPEVPVNVVIIFFHILGNEPVRKTDIEKELGYTSSSCSRLTLWLSTQTVKGREGLGLIERKYDPNNLRRVFYTATPKGRDLYNKAMRLLEYSL